LLSEKLTQPSRQWLFLVATMGLALALSLSLVFAGEASAKKKHPRHARPFNQASTVAQSGVTQATTTPVPLTGTIPYTFLNTKKLRSINRVTVQLTGSATIPGDAGLVLGLDGINTGIPLTGFGLTPTTATFTARGIPANADQIKAALQSDGTLVGTVIDNTPADGNILTIPASSNTTLQISGKRNR
jgi:hypothetical protein